MAKDWDKLDPYQQHKRSKEYAKIYGVNYDDYQEADRGSQGNFDQDGFNEAISKAANNRYDVRRGVEAAKLAGYEGSDQLSNRISDMSSLDKTHEFLADYHQKEFGKDEFKSRSHFGKVTDSFVNMDRTNFTGKMEDSFSTQSDQQNEQPTTELPKDAREDTSQYQYFKQFQRDPAEMQIFGQPKDEPTPEGDQGEITIQGNPDQQRGKAALEFADNYKLDLVKGLNLKPEIS